jgi:nucleoside phosphorylase
LHEVEPYIFSTGCAGGPVERTTLGDVVVSTKLVDFDMGHHFELFELEDLCSDGLCGW